MMETQTGDLLEWVGEGVVCTGVPQQTVLVVLSGRYGRVRAGTCEAICCESADRRAAERCAAQIQYHELGLRLRLLL